MVAHSIIAYRIVHGQKLGGRHHSLWGCQKSGRTRLTNTFANRVKIEAEEGCAGRACVLAYKFLDRKLVSHGDL